MSRPTRILLQEAATTLRENAPRSAAGSSRGGSRPVRTGGSSLRERRPRGDGPRLEKPAFSTLRIVGFREQSQRQTRYLLLRAVPRTATPMDVRRALIQQKLVEPGFPLTNITPSAISFPRTLSLLRPYHVTFPDAASATRALERLNSLNGTNNTALENRLFPEAPASPYRHSSLIANDAEEFQKAQMDGLEKIQWDRMEQRNDLEHWDRVRADREVVRIDPTLSGRRVLLWGFGRFMSETETRIWASRMIQGRPDAKVDALATGILASQEGVTRLTPPPNTLTNYFCLTFDSVEKACRAVRRLDTTVHKPNLYGDFIERACDERIIRAEVVW